MIILYFYLRPQDLYRKIHKKSKRQTLWNRFALIKKRYHRFWTHYQDSGYI